MGLKNKNSQEHRETKYCLVSLFAGTPRVSQTHSISTAPDLPSYRFLVSHLSTPRIFSYCCVPHLQSLLRMAWHPNFFLLLSPCSIPPHVDCRGGETRERKGPLEAGRSRWQQQQGRSPTEELHPRRRFASHLGAWTD